GGAFPWRINAMWPPPASAAHACCSSSANAEPPAGNKASAMSPSQPSQRLNDAIGLRARARVSRAGSAEHSRRRQREGRDRHVGAPEGVAYRIRDGAAETRIAALAEAAQAERVGRRPNLLVEAVDRWHVGGGR